MVSSQTIDVIVGLATVFLTVSLICSAINETLAAIFSLRARTLKGALNSLLGVALAQAVVNHPSVPAAPSRSGKQPSYIEPALFAVALLDEITRPVVLPAHGAPAFARVDAAVNGPTPNPMLTAQAGVQRSLSAFVASADGDYKRVVMQISTWFDGYMDRVGGAYKRRTQWLLVIFAIVVVVTLNIDALRIFQQLSAQPAFAASVAAHADRLIKKAEPDQVGQPTPTLGQLMSSLSSDIATMPFPVGWPDFHFKSLWISFWQWQKIVGLLITAIAASLGAPFWFDALSRLASLRSGGAKPC